MSHNGDCIISCNNHVNEIKFNLNKSVQVCRIMVQTDMYVTKDNIIFTMIDTNKQRHTFLSPTSGTVTKLYIHEWDILSYGSLILEYEECRHTITFKNLCATCGIQLNSLNHSLLTSNSSKHVISMEPSFPAIKITTEAAAQYDNQERGLLLRKRKLHLLVDLDQTLVHTTNTINHHPSSPDVVAFQLNVPMVQTLYTKLRPGVREFLTNLQSLYQFHIVTFGDRPYANAIAKLIDPDKTFFSHRILSRDECLSLTDKAANLSTLFPCGDSLVCIIDDRADVWNYAPNLVQVKPYAWFKDVDDINATYLPSLTKTKDDHRDRSFKEQSHTQTTSPNNDVVVNDSDVYLQRLEMILKRIHTMFYQTYDQLKRDKSEVIPDLKQIIPNSRKQVLNSVSLCFSHTMPQDYPLEQFRGTLMAQAMGAKVTFDLQFDHNDTNPTTHLIAGKQTLKVYQARQNNIKVVTPEWLIDCYEQWEKKSEEHYILTENYDIGQCRLFTEITPRVLKRRHCDVERRASATGEVFLNRQHSNCTMDIDERFTIETKMINVTIKNDDETSSPHSKRQCTTPFMSTVIQKRENFDDEDSDSSYTRKLTHLILGKKNGDNSDEENLSDDEAPRGWKRTLNESDNIHRCS